MLGGELLGSKLSIVEVEVVVLARIVGLVDIHAVHHVDQLAEEHTRREGDLATEACRDLGYEPLRLVEAETPVCRIAASQATILARVISVRGVPAQCST